MAVNYWGRLLQITLMIVFHTTLVWICPRVNGSIALYEVEDQKYVTMLYCNLQQPLDLESALNFAKLKESFVKSVGDRKIVYTSGSLLHIGKLL